MAHAMCVLMRVNLKTQLIKNLLKMNSSEIPLDIDLMRLTHTSSITAAILSGKMYSGQLAEQKFCVAMQQRRELTIQGLHILNTHVFIHSLCKP